MTPGTIVECREASHESAKLVLGSSWRSGDRRQCEVQEKLSLFLARFEAHISRNMKLPATIFSLVIICGLSHGEAAVRFAGEKKLNGLVSELLDISSVSKSSNRFTFSRSNDG